MEIGETLYVVDRKPWREWLEANFDTAKDVWLVYPNKASGEPRILIFLGETNIPVARCLARAFSLSPRRLMAYPCGIISGWFKASLVELHWLHALHFLRESRGALVRIGLSQLMRAPIESRSQQVLAPALVLLNDEQVLQQSSGIRIERSKTDKIQLYS